VKFSPSGQELARWGHTGHKLGEFWYPDSVAVGPNGAIYVADTANGRIQKLAPDGTPLLAWKIKGKHGHVFPPEGIAVDRSGNVFVVSPRYNHILRYSSSGKLTAKWGKTGSTLGRFRQLNGVTVDSRGDVYVADTLNDRVQEFSPRGTPLRLWW
jgi:sugar lactone lactonase YvrE